MMTSTDWIITLFAVATLALSWFDRRALVEVVRDLKDAITDLKITVIKETSKNE
jgi:hypothetical protein